MNPLEHPYSKKHSLKTTNQLLKHINDRLKPETKYSYYTYNHQRDRIIEALNKCQDIDDQAERYANYFVDSLALYGTHITPEQFINDWDRYLTLLPYLQGLDGELQERLAQRQMMNLPVEDTTKVSSDERKARWEEMKQILSIPSDFTTAITGVEKRQKWLAMHKELVNAMDNASYAII